MWVDAWFTLAYARYEFPVFRVVQASKHKFAHFVRLQSIDERDHSLLNWIKEAWQLNR